MVQQLSDFDFDLPEALIATAPPRRRGDSRMLVLDGATGQTEDARFADIERYLDARDLLVLNDTRVIPARLFGHKGSGGRVEMLLERLESGDEALVQLRANRAPALGARLSMEGGGRFIVLERAGVFFRVRLESPGTTLLTYFERHGHMPLPPYIRRGDSALDRERYQTVYAREPGAVAAPTAGLHFTEPLLERLRAQGVRTAAVTLHVGAGTFLPVREEDVAAHRLHSERVEVGDELLAAVAETRRRGGRVVAAGTTVVRSLESAAAGGELRRLQGETDIFIMPGFRFRVVDALLTNFHLPRSTLLMLVSAFAGRERVLDAYRHAVAAGYRFFSYGDAMFLPRPTPEARS